MKQLFMIFALTMSTAGAFAQSMKMVVKNNGELEGIYVSTKGSNYVVSVQDDFTVPIAGHKIVTYSAAKGQGIVFRSEKRTGNINVRKGPGTNFPVVGKMIEDDGVPTTYPCLGKENGWYKIRINGKVGYVRDDMANWHGMDCF